MFRLLTLGAIVGVGISAYKFFKNKKKEMPELKPEQPATSA